MAGLRIRDKEHNTAVVETLKCSRSTCTTCCLLEVSEKLDLLSIWSGTRTFRKVS